jgi:hypothetical protein
VVTTAPPANSAAFSCGAGDVTCLVAAITTANGNGEANAIRLEVGTNMLRRTPQPRSGPEVTLFQGGVGFSSHVLLVDTSGMLSLHRLTVGPATRDSVIVNRGTAILDRVVVRDWSGDGGAVSNGGRMLIVGSDIRDNASQHEGGGILNSGALTIVHSVIQRTRADRAGGILNFTNSTGNIVLLTVPDSTIAAISGQTPVESGTGWVVSCASFAVRSSGTIRIAARSGGPAPFRVRAQLEATTIARNSGSGTIGARTDSCPMGPMPAMRLRMLSCQRLP